MLKMDPLIYLSPEETGTAIRAFMAERCPACEGEKLRQVDPFCADCYARLPQLLRESISDNSKFIATYNPALQYLHDHATQPAGVSKES